jgi:hypothetical protein
MEEEGTVSLWLGRASSKESFDALLKTSYSEDGDFLGSPFSRAFAVGWYDEGFREAKYLATPASSLPDLLRNFSYSKVVISNLETAGATIHAGENCVVLLYNQRHMDPKADWSSGGVSFRFVVSGCYR